MKRNIKHWLEEIIPGVPEGMRHASAVRMVGYLYYKGMDSEVVWVLLTQWNQRNTPPLGQQEIISIFQSTKKWANPRYTPPMSDEEIREIRRAVRKQLREERRNNGRKRA